MNLEALLNELDGLRDGGGVAAPVALGLGEDRPPLAGNRLHRQAVCRPGPALCFLGPGAKPKLEAPNKQNLPNSLYQLQSLFRCIIKKFMVKTIAYKYIKSITGIPNPYLLNR